MSRLNKKSTKEAFLKELKDLESKAKSYSTRHPDETTNHFYVAQWALMVVAKDLGIAISLKEFSEPPK